MLSVHALVLFIPSYVRKETYSLRDTLGNNGNGSDLREFHQFHGRAVNGSGGSEVDDGVDVAVLGKSLFDILVDRKQSLAGSPVPLRRVSFANQRCRMVIALTFC